MKLIAAGACRAALLLRLQAARRAKEISATRDERRKEKKKKKEEEEEGESEGKKGGEGGEGVALALGPAASAALLLARCRDLCSNAAAPLSVSSARLARLSRSAGE